MIFINKERHKMKWHTYEISPIDIGWRSLNSVWDTAQQLGARSALTQAKADGDGEEGTTSSYFLEAWKSAKDAAGEAGWEGDFRNDPCVFWIPNDTEFSFGFVVKQDNNGTTYVMSPVALPHLDPLM